MSGISGCFQASKLPGVNGATALKQQAFRWWVVLVLAIATLTMVRNSFADSGTGTNGASARVDFRIVIPAIIRVTTIQQPDNVVIEDRHIASGYIDIDAGTYVKLTNNTHNGYQLTARYDAQLFSSVEVRLSNQKLTASSGSGSMHVPSALAIEALVPISYRLHLAHGTRSGQYRWPVTLAFSLVVA